MSGRPATRRSWPCTASDSSRGPSQGREVANRNGLFAAYERLLIQRRVPGELHGRAFALEDTMVSWALAAAFLLAGGAASLLGARGLIFATATGELIVAAVALVALRSWMLRADGRVTASLYRSRP